MFINMVIDIHKYHYDLVIDFVIWWVIYWGDDVFFPFLKGDNLNMILCLL